MRNLFPQFLILVWKLAASFTPGDLLAYEHENFTFAGRFVSGNENEIVVSRNRQANEIVERRRVIGKVFSVYWRGSSSDSAKHDLAPPEAARH